MSDDDRPRDVRLQIRIDASPATVFALLTDPARMKTWFAEFVEADARPGGLFRISGPTGVSIEGKYLEVIPNRKVGSPGAAWKGSSPASRRWSSGSSPPATARWSTCAITDCRHPASSRIAAAGSIPGWSSSKMRPKAASRPDCGATLPSSAARSDGGGPRHELVDAGRRSDGLAFRRRCSNWRSTPRPSTHSATFARSEPYRF
jgi:uncharacterized protein YndB with AHSA1/START domain